MSSTGDQIRRAREQRGHTRERVSTDTGVSVSVQRRIETGKGGGPRSVAVLRQHFGLTDPTDRDNPPTPEDHLPKVSDASLLAEVMRRWHQMAAELERLRARAATPLGVTAPVPEHLLRGPVTRNTVAGDSAVDFLPTAEAGGLPGSTTDTDCADRVNGPDHPNR